MNPLLTITKANGLTSIQDMGRFGFAHLGITQGGVADEYSYHWANKLLNNPFASAVIEVTMGGFEASFNQNSLIAITGANDGVAIDGVCISTWRCIKVNKGQTLSITLPRNGLRHYIALLGGVDAPMHHNSRSTVARDKLGGLRNNGTGLVSGDVIHSRLASLSLNPLLHQKLNQQLNQKKVISVAPQYIPNFAPSQTITARLLLGSQQHLFTSDAIHAVFANTYRIDTQSNKMGYQLMGQPITTPTEHLISEGISLGAVQIPPSGLPIIMLCERQTIGGYPKLGNVARLDLCKIAQSKPGTTVKFAKADVNLCFERYKQWLNFFQTSL